MSGQCLANFKYGLFPLYILTLSYFTLIVFTTGYSHMAKFNPGKSLGILPSITMAIFILDNLALSNLTLINVTQDNSTLCNLPWVIGNPSITLSCVFILWIIFKLGNSKWGNLALVNPLVNLSMTIIILKSWGRSDLTESLEGKGDNIQGGLYFLYLDFNKTHN